jgi:hypothetical protein
VIVGLFVQHYTLLITFANISVCGMFYARKGEMEMLFNHITYQVTDFALLNHFPLFALLVSVTSNKNNTKLLMLVKLILNVTFYWCENRRGARVSYLDDRSHFINTCAKIYRKKLLFNDDYIISHFVHAWAINQIEMREYFKALIEFSLRLSLFVIHCFCLVLLYFPHSS